MWWAGGKVLMPGASWSFQVLGEVLAKTQEAVIDNTWLYLAIRPNVARWNYLQYNYADRDLEEIGVEPLVKDVGHGPALGQWLPA